MNEVTYKSTVVTSKRDMLEVQGFDVKMQLLVLSEAAGVSAFKKIFV